MASLIKRGDVWYLCWREGTRQRRRSLETSSKTIAKRRAEAFERERAENKWQTRPERLNPTPSEFWDLYAPWLRAHRARRTVELKATQWEKLRRELNPARLGDVTPAQVEKLKLRWVDDGLSPVTINGFLKDGKAIYNEALTLPLGDAKPLYNGPNPFASVKPLPVPQRPKRTLSPQEVAHLVEVAQEVARAEEVPQGGAIDAVVALAGYAGLRKSEIIAARWTWIDWNAKTIRVTQSQDFTAKAKRDRTLPLADKLIAVLEPYKQEDGFIFRPEVGEPGANPARRADIQRAFCHVAKKAKLEWATPHLLRHSWITNLVKAGVPIAKLSQWAGHSSIKITADMYSHLQGFDADINRV